MMLDLTLGVRAEFETKVWPYDRPQADKCYDARPDPLLGVGLPMFRPRPLWFLEPLLRREVDQPFFPLAYRDHGDHKHFVMHLVDEAEA